MMFKITTPLTLLCVLLLSIGSYAQLPDGQEPGGKSWADSYQANGLCWCDSTFDHDLDDIDEVSFTINGVKRNIRDVCDELKNHPLVRDYVEGDPIYNDIQCGNGPANTAIDEVQCPGLVDSGRDGCSVIGPRWDIEWLESRERFGGDGETEPETETNFVPDTNKVYYIDSAYHNVRLAATGESEDAYTTALSTTGSNVEWKFVAKGNGSWHIQRANGGSLPRLRTDNSPNADMQATGWSGTYTYYTISTGDISNSYFLTLTDGPSAYDRLQINNSQDVKMVPSADHNGTWESFYITEAGTTTASFSRLEAEDYDAMSGIQTEASSEGTDNVGWINNTDWIKFDDVNLTGAQSIDARVASRYSGGDIEIRLGSATGALLGTLTTTNTGGNQVYKTISANLSSVSGVQDVYLVFKGGNGYLFNLNWVEFSDSSKSSKDIVNANGPEITAYPNPVVNSLTIENAASGILRVYDISGGLVLSSDIASNKEVVNVEGLTNGIYYFQINQDEDLTILKIVK